MEVATQLSCSIWDSILGQTKVAQEKGSDPLLWSIQVSSNLSSVGITLPSLELANHLVSHICWENNVPIAWKFLEKALALKIVPPCLVLGLLSARSFFSTFLYLSLCDFCFGGFFFVILVLLAKSNHYCSLFLQICWPAQGPYFFVICVFVCPFFHVFRFVVASFFLIL